MTSQVLFYIIISILISHFIIEKWLDYLNALKFNNPIPEELNDVYNQDEYEKSQQYKKENYRLSLISSSFMMLVTLAFFFTDGFAYIDAIARKFTDNTTGIALLFFGIIAFGVDLISTPFSYYSTFVIEEKYGFNKSSKSLFFIDKLKGWLLGGTLGAGLLALIIWFYEYSGELFWVYAWALIFIFSVLVNMFYARIIVPLFNKQSPLAAGSLRDKIEAYAKTVGFKLNNIYIIDGSKRSTKANAYFSGFGKEKRITLYDTLINDLDEEEIIAVLAHEVGHYKKNHILINLISSTLLTGITLGLLSLFVANPILSQALGIQTPEFHIGMVAFFILYSPISTLTGLFMNHLSRIFEYQADDFARKTYAGQPLINALKKLSKSSFSNLTPHPLYVFMHYSHPTLLQRYRNLTKKN